MPTFHFFTFLTRIDQYERMRETMTSAGFDDANSVFTVLDNRGGNAHDPYQAIGKAVAEAEAPYAVFLHQDLLFDQGHGYADLVRVLNELEAHDPTWAVAGNAGLSAGYEEFRALVDHCGPHFYGELPAKVVSLDENFLVVKRASGLSCSPELSGFHIYATDLCLRAYQRGLSAYVVDFHLMHLSTTVDVATLARLAPAFERHWTPAVGGACIKSTCLVYLMAKNPVLDRLLRFRGAIRRLYSRPHWLRRVDALLRPWRASWLPE